VTYLLRIAYRYFFTLKRTCNTTGRLNEAMICAGPS